METQDGRARYPSGARHPPFPRRVPTPPSMHPAAAGSTYLPRPLCGQPGLRKRIADLALHDRQLDSIIGTSAFEVADQSGGCGFELDDAPLEQLDTRSTLGHAANIGHADPESESRVSQAL